LIVFFSWVLMMLSFQLCVHFYCWWPWWGVALSAIAASFFYAKDGRQIGHLLGANDRATYEAAIRSLLASNDSAAATH
jgi:hypothetical protein